MTTSTIEQTLAELLPQPAVSDIVERYGDAYAALFKAEEVEWMQSPDMGQRSMEKLRAIKTLVKDIQSKKQTAITDASSSKAVFQAMQDMQYFETEHIRVLYLNNRNHIIKWEDVSIGQVNTASTDAKCIFSTAVRLKASSIILVHNHPSGYPEPSAQDIRFTQQIKAAGALLDIPLLDHVIIGAGTYYSLAEEKQL